MGSNKMRRKTIVIFLTLMLLALLLPGCTVQEQPPTENTGATYPAGVTKIVMTYQTMGSSHLEDLRKVEAAINEISIAQIGVAVEFRTINAVEAFTAYSSWISNGQTVDLMVLNYQDILGYISKGMLHPIDDLLDLYAPGIRQIMAEGYPLTEGSVVDGKTYGAICVPQCAGSGGGLWIPKRYLEEVGFDFREKKIYSMDELDRLFMLLKGKYPDKYPLGQITSMEVSSTMSFYQKLGDTLGTGLSSGGIVEEGSYQVENIFATEQYYDFLQYLRKWYKLGYIYPEAATTNATKHELAQSGMILTYPLSSLPGIIGDDAFGEETVCLRTTPVQSGAQYSKAGFWTIPVTSSSPEAAMKFLDLMLSDARITNLLAWGIEGEHYVFTDRERGIIDCPEGIDSSNITYMNPLGLYGDKRKQYVLKSEDLRELQEAYSQEALTNPIGIRGFIYSPSNVESQLDMLETIVAKYVPVLESGSVDLDVYYPAFLDALKKAGIDAVIADKQQQLDAWLAQQETP